MKLTNKQSRTSSSVSRYITRKELSPQALIADPSIWSFKPLAVLQQDCYTIEMILDQLYTSDVSGNVVLTFGNSPTGASNWSNAANFFDEYRVLALKAEVRPMEFNGSAVVQAPFTSVIDFDNAAALTGYTLAAQYSSQKEYRGSQVWSRTAYMSGAENATFISTASPANSYYLKMYSSGNTASTNLGRVIVTYVVQFRGKGI